MTSQKRDLRMVQIRRWSSLAIFGFLITVGWPGTSHADRDRDHDRDHDRKGKNEAIVNGIFACSGNDITAYVNGTTKVGGPFEDKMANVDCSSLFNEIKIDSIPSILNDSNRLDCNFADTVVPGTPNDSVVSNDTRVVSFSCSGRDERLLKLIERLFIALYQSQSS